MAENPALREELEFFESQKETLVATHAGQFALISGKRLVGVYTTEAEAYQAGLNQLGNKPFLIRQVRSDEPRLQIPVISLGMTLGSDSR